MEGKPPCHTRMGFARLHPSSPCFSGDAPGSCPAQLTCVPSCRPSLVCLFPCFLLLHQAACHDAMGHVASATHARLLVRHPVFPIERPKPCIDRTASREDCISILCGSRRRERPHRGDVVHARVDMLVRVANSANGGSRRALPWAKVKEWPKMPPKPVLGVDPDVSGALAVLEGREEGWSLQIYDVPTVSERVGTRLRRRHCPEGIACALKKLELPPGCVAYVEMARPLPQNGRQGWYGSGFGYGVWMGALAAHGVETVAVHPNTWKKDMMLTKANQWEAVECRDRGAEKGSSVEPLNRLALKDRSREIAAYVFPQIMDEVKRKKDHGRAEALLLAAWGCGMRCESHGIEEEVLSLLDQV